jgi:hypothetical protein
MATTTPNFGWPVPTSTDLVKDGATAIEALGDGVDASLVDLKGGTTDQVLAKNSNTDMDFKWVTSDDANAIQNTIVDAKGDLIAASASDVPARLAVGSDGNMLVADSTESTGLRYIPNTAGAKNGLINSAFDVSQRGATITGIAADNTYTADRWYVTRGGNLDYALKTVAGGNNPPTSFDAYGQYVNQSAANPFITVQQTLETKDSIRFAGVTATLSFWARATANTAKSKSITAAIGYNTTANTKINTLVGTTTFTTLFGTASTDWTFCTLTVGVPSTAKTVGAYFIQNPSGGLAVGDGFEVTGVQLERSAVATGFQRNAGTIQGELAACQRYFQKSYAQGTAPATNGTANGLVFASTTATAANTNYLVTVKLPVVMRTSPTLTIYSFTTSQTGRVSDGAGTDLAAGSGSTNLIADSQFTVQNSSGGLITAAQGGFVFHYVANGEL